MEENKSTFEGVFELDGNNPLTEMLKAALGGRRQQEPISYEAAKERLAYLRDPANGVQGQDEAEQELLSIIYQHEFLEFISAQQEAGTLKSRFVTHVVPAYGESTIRVPHGSKVLGHTIGPGGLLQVHFVELVGVKTHQDLPYWVYKDGDVVDDATLDKQVRMEVVQSGVDKGTVFYVYSASARHV